MNVRMHIKFDCKIVKWSGYCNIFATKSKITILIAVTEWITKEQAMAQWINISTS